MSLPPSVIIDSCGRIVGLYLCLCFVMFLMQGEHRIARGESGVGAGDGAGYPQQMSSRRRDDDEALALHLAGKGE